jgi:hypothetical protein
MVNAALNGYFHDLYQRLAAQTPAEVRSWMDALLLVPKEESFSTFELLKATQIMQASRIWGARSRSLAGF